MKSILGTTLDESMEQVWGERVDYFKDDDYLDDEVRKLGIHPKGLKIKFVGLMGSPDDDIEVSEKIIKACKNGKSVKRNIKSAYVVTSLSKDGKYLSFQEGGMIHYFEIVSKPTDYSEKVTSIFGNKLDLAMAKAIDEPVVDIFKGWDDLDADMKKLGINPKTVNVKHLGITGSDDDPDDDISDDIVKACDNGKQIKPTGMTVYARYKLSKDGKYFCFQEMDLHYYFEIVKGRISESLKSRYRSGYKSRSSQVIAEALKLRTNNY